MKNLLFILPVICAVLICSCCPLDKGASGSIERGVGEVIVGWMLDSVMVATVSMQAYYVEYDRWPQDQNDMAVFCCGRNWQYAGQFWKSCSNAGFEVLDDDSLSYRYTITHKNGDRGSGTITYSSKVQRPDASREELEEMMQDMLLLREEMKQSKQKKP